MCWELEALPCQHRVSPNFWQSAVQADHPGIKPVPFEGQRPPSPHARWLISPIATWPKCRASGLMPRSAGAAVARRQAQSSVVAANAARLGMARSSKNECVPANGHVSRRSAGADCGLFSWQAVSGVSGQSQSAHMRTIGSWQVSDNCLSPGSWL